MFIKIIGVVSLNIFAMVTFTSVLFYCVTLTPISKTFVDDARHDTNDQAHYEDSTSISAHSVGW